MRETAGGGKWKRRYGIANRRNYPNASKVERQISITTIVLVKKRRYRYRKQM